MIKDLSELREQIHTLGLARLEEQIVQLAKPNIFITRTLMSDTHGLPIGASRLGGLPDLPADFVWKYDGEKPLTFIAQFRLSEIAPYDVEQILPKYGMLYFFYEADAQPWGAYNEQNGWQVIYLDDENTPLVRTPHPTFPGEISRDIDALPAHQVTFSGGITLPSIDYGEEARYGVDFDDANKKESYWQLVDTTCPRWSTPCHYLLGHPQPEQANNIEELCVVGAHNYKTFSDAQRAEYELQALNWQFLFQIDSDNSLDVCWGDVGKLYICIPKASLAARRFEDCWTILQCG